MAIRREDVPAEVERLLAGRRGKRRGQEIDFSCVNESAHTNHDATPSASWNRRKGTWHCMTCGAGGSTANLAQQLGIDVESAVERGEKAAIVATYDYTDADGKLLYQVVRLNPKSFRQRQPNGSGWTWSMRGVELVLYRLPGLAEGPSRVYITEGEKHADRLVTEGLTATTWPGGAVGRGKGQVLPSKQKWQPRYNAALAGAEVVILPDNDQPGEDAANAIAASLTASGNVVKVLKLPGLGPKGDIIDWLFAGGTPEELEQMADECPAWEPPAEGAASGGFALTDAGNAECFAHLFGDRVRYDWKRERWLVWDRHRWVPDATGELIRLAIEAARFRGKQAADLDGDAAKAAFAWAKQSESAGKIEALLKLGRALPPVSDAGEGWDSNPLLLGCENGVVNLATGAFRPGQREDRITKSTGIVYDARAVCERWERFMVEVFPDPQVREFMRLWCGYCLTGLTREEIWVILYGRGANGKSTFMDTLRWVGGEYADTIAFATIEKGKEQSIPSDMAALAGMRIVTTSEADKATRINEARLKMLTGQDPVKARELYKSGFTFVPELKLLVAVNDRPVIRDDSEGMWRRVRLVPCMATFDAATRDPDLRNKLKAELPGILAWCVRAAVEWHRTGLPTPPAIAVATVEYREESDPLAPFITERCVLTGQARTGAATLYKAYKGWAESQAYGQRETLTATMFGRLMADRVTKKHTMKGAEYLGVGLVSDGWVAQTHLEPVIGPEGLESNDDGLGMGLTSMTGSIPTISSISPRACEQVVENSVITRQPVIGPCDCPEKHPGPTDCADGEWWSDDGTDGGIDGWHCAAHHPQPREISQEDVT